MTLPVTKMSGAQNTFFILDARFENFDTQLKEISSGLSRSKVARELCHSSLFSKADGCIYIEKDPALDFKWDFYNSDGSPAQMCGNAARCVSQLAYDQKWTDSSFVQFRAASGIIKADVISNGFVRVKMNTPQILEQDKTLEYNHQTLKGLSVNTGVPHFVMASSDKDLTNRQSLRNIAKHIRQSNDLAPEGCNVSWVSLNPQKDLTFSGITFERGVEDFTQACGTGAVAMAVFLISRSLQPFNQDIKIKLPGGVLTVNISTDYRQATLSGAVEYLKQFELKPNWIKINK